MYLSCHSGYRKPDIVHICAISAPVVLETRISDYALLLLGLWLPGRCFFAGILTELKNYRITNAVIVRVHRQVSIPHIMRRVSNLPHTR